jgi:hypothetical protein
LRDGYHRYRKRNGLPAHRHSYQGSHALGSAWDGDKEEWRANVLAYDPDGQNKRI